ncbi:uncharacterized protein LOC135112115 isoform X2 [Scylla paramamosain]|uniref:uncharacterized protein LOC135112115 isoform X2 n=1 Tax=Scylla paramamosain TaxID=85552 RepID=UPI0030830C09
MLGSLRFRRKSKKEVASEAAPPRSFTDPARQIFHELRAGTTGGGLRGLTCSLQGSPRSPRRHPPGGTAPPSLQSSPVPTRREVPQQHLEAAPAALVTSLASVAHVAPAASIAPASAVTPAAAVAPAAGSPGLARRRHPSQEHLRPSPRGSPAMGRRAVGLEAGQARLGGLRDKEGRAAAPRDAEGLSQPGTKHLPNNNEAVTSHKQPTISSRNVSSQAPSVTMAACMYVCMYVCIYVCMYVCIALCPAVY